MVFIFGIFTRRGAPVEPLIVSTEKLQDGSARIGDLVEVVGGCPRFPGDACDLVGGYKSVVIEYHGELYYRIIA